MNLEEFDRFIMEHLEIYETALRYFFLNFLLRFFIKNCLFDIVL